MKAEDLKDTIRRKAQDAQSNPAISEKSKACMFYLAETLDEPPAPDDLSDEDWQAIEGFRLG